jgi:hypothetical protein
MRIEAMRYVMMVPKREEWPISHLRVAKETAPALGESH